MGLPRSLAVLLSIAVVSGLALMESGEARKNGVSGRAVGGCTCHGNAQPWTGVAGQLPMELAIEGVPEEYEPGMLYPLELEVAGGLPYLKAGFNLNATAGILSVPDGEANVQITTKDTFGAVDGEATHKTPDSRAWRVDWTAPPEGAGPVVFFLAINSVNGNDQPDALDQWNVASAMSAEKNLAPRAATIAAVRDAAPGSVTINWTPSPDRDIVRHDVYAVAAGADLADAKPALSIENASMQELALSGLEPGREFNFVVRATDKGGLFTDSPPASLRLAAAPAPANVTALPEPDHKDAPSPAAAVLVVLVLALAALWRRRQ